MRKTIYKNEDRTNSWEDTFPYVRKSEPVAPMLVEYEFYNPDTKEKMTSPALYVSATANGSLKLSLKSAIVLLEQRNNKFWLEYEFDGLTFRIEKEDKFEDVYDMICATLDIRQQSYKKLEELRNSKNINI